MQKIARHYGYLSFILLILSILPIAVSSSDSDSKPQENRRAIVIFNDGKEINAEVADNAESRKLGLMFREKLGESEGMLFIFEKNDFHSIWMKNCKIPLDIIWIGNDQKIVHIQHNVQPCPAGEDCPSIFPFKRSRYVLEVNAGTALRSSLKPGDKVILLGISRNKE
ncbi:MAG: DUF192 domain-containing protein [Acidobacteriota bacterium]